MPITVSSPSILYIEIGSSLPLDLVRIALQVHIITYLYTVLHYIILYYITLYYIILYNITLYYIIVE